MTDTDPNDDVFDRRLDWAVGEIDGQQAPDVTGSVMARLDEVRTPARSRHAWLAAALVLLGVSAVIAVFWSKNSDDLREATQQEQQDPSLERLQDMPYVVVRTAAEIAALPQNTQGVQMVGMGFAGVDALIKRAPYVRKLLLRGDEIEGGTVFRALWFEHLRHLDIVGCKNVTPNVIAQMAKDTQLLQVKFGAHEWLTFEHLQLLAKSGIEPMFDDPSHPMVLSVATLICDHGEKMRERQLADFSPTRFVTVRSVADIAALPLDAEAVDGLDLDDQAVGALARLTNLRHLRLRSGAQTKVIPVLDLNASYSPRTSEGNRKSVTDAGLAQLVPLQNLQRLELVGTVEVKGPGLAHLARLPKLRDVSLICIDTSDEGFTHLWRAGRLKRLRIVRNHGFSLRGMEDIVGMQLESLVIEACPQLGSYEYALVRQIRGLRELRIRQASADAWRNDSQRKLTAEEQAVLAKAHSAASGSRVDDAVLAAIEDLEDLQTLELTFTEATARGYQHLGRLNFLRSLTLVGNPGLTVESLRSFHPSIRRLDISGCENIDDSVGAAVRAQFPMLETLRICNNERLTDLSDIAEIKTLRVLDVRACVSLGPKAAAALRKCDDLRELDYTMCPNMPATLADYLRERGVAVKQKFW